MRREEVGHLEASRWTEADDDDALYSNYFGCAFELFKGRGGLRRKNAQVPEDARDPIVKTILVMGYKTDYKTSTL